MNEVLMPCEGSGCRCHGTHFGWLCSMCGEIVPIDQDGVALPHDRLDILTMLDRGAFG